MKKKPYRWLLELLFVLLIFFAVRAYQTRDLPSGIAPPLVAQSIQGARLDLAQFRGQPVLLYFWASWCPVCEFSQSAVSNIAAEYPVLSVAYRSGSDKQVQQYMHKHQLDWPVLNDPEGYLAQPYQIGAVPATFILNSQGEIVFSELGFVTTWGLRVRLWLADWL